MKNLHGITARWFCNRLLLGIEYAVTMRFRNNGRRFCVFWWRIGFEGDGEVVDVVLCGCLHADVLFSVQERTTRSCVDKGRVQIENKPFGRGAFLQWPMAVASGWFAGHQPALAWTVEHLS